jgi:hypothetical protein
MLKRREIATKLTLLGKFEEPADLLAISRWENFIFMD